MLGVECRRGTGSVVVSVGCYMGCSEWRVLSVGEKQEELWCVLVVIWRVVSGGCRVQERNMNSSGECWLLNGV